MSKQSQAIFFAAASPKRAGKDQISVYKTIVKEIKDQGFQISYDWVSNSKKEVLSNQEAYSLVMNALHKSDLLLADVTVPSIGVGQQIAMALHWRIPVVCIYNEDIEYTPSKMLPVDQTSLFKIMPYKIKNLKSTLKNILSDTKSQRFVKFNFIVNTELNSFLEEESKKRQMSKSQFLRFIIKNWREQTENGVN